MKKIKIITLLILIFCLYGCVLEDSDKINENSNNSIQENSTELYNDANVSFVSDEKVIGNLSVEIAENKQEIEKGLMNRKVLPNGTGMLFVFQSSSPRRFWMKYTYIPLDIIFINEKKEVIKIKHASPGFNGNRFCSNPDYYCSGRPAKFVVEANRGYANKTGLEKGDSLVISRNNR